MEYHLFSCKLEDSEGRFTADIWARDEAHARLMLEHYLGGTVLNLDCDDMSYAFGDAPTSVKELPRESGGALVLGGEIFNLKRVKS